MTIKLNLTIELENVTHIELQRIKNNLHLHLINHPLNNIDLIREFNINGCQLSIINQEQVTVGVHEEFTLTVSNKK